MSEGRLEAVIWDMDGVIADTAEFHYLAWKDVFAGKGVDLTRESFMRLFGQRPDTIVEAIMGDNVPPAEFNAINTAKQADFRRRAAGHIQALPGAVELIKSIHEHEVRQAIASSAPPENIEVVTGGLGIKGCFQAIAYGYEVPEGKPSPQIFLLAAQKLGVKPSDCVVFEDAIAGVDGAKRAGMKCVAVTNSHPGGRLKKADLIVATLEAVTITDLAGLFHSGRGKKNKE
jgi:beta-phosphoglucomutase family hydrolase